MNKMFHVKLKPGGLNPSNSYLETGELKDYLPQSVFGGNGKKELAERLVTIIAGGKSFLTDIPRKHPQRFKDRAMAAEVISLLNLEAGDTIIYEEVAPLTFKVIKSVHGQNLSGDSAPLGNATTSARKEQDKERKWIQKEARPEQQKFRRGIVERDGLRCALTGCEEASVLDAAHLKPRAKDGSDDPTNGIILRADIHRLFDAKLLMVDADTRTVQFVSDMTDPDYRALSGLTLNTRADLSILKEAPE